MKCFIDKITDILYTIGTIIVGAFAAIFYLIIGLFLILCPVLIQLIPWAAFVAIVYLILDLLKS